MADKSAIGGPEHVCGMLCDGQDRGGGCDVQDRWRQQTATVDFKWTEVEPNSYVGMIRNCAGLSASMFERRDSMSDDLRYLSTPSGLIPISDRFPNAKLSGNISSAPVDAHAQMLAARVDGLEKDINGLQFVWGRVKDAEAATAHAHARIDELARTMPGASRSVVLLKRALNEISPVSLLARDIAEFLRNR